MAYFLENELRYQDILYLYKLWEMSKQTIYFYVNTKTILL